MAHKSRIAALQIDSGDDRNVVKAEVFSDHIVNLKGAALS
jgi:hypothetical protein